MNSCTGLLNMMMAATTAVSANWQDTMPYTYSQRR